VFCSGKIYYDLIQVRHPNHLGTLNERICRASSFDFFSAFCKRRRNARRDTAMRARWRSCASNSSRRSLTTPSNRFGLNQQRKNRRSVPPPTPTCLVVHHTSVRRQAIELNGTARRVRWCQEEPQNQVPLLYVCSFAVSHRRVGRARTQSRAHGRICSRASTPRSAVVGNVSLLFAYLLLCFVFSTHCLLHFYIYSAAVNDRTIECSAMRFSTSVRRRWRCRRPAFTNCTSKRARTFSNSFLTNKKPRFYHTHAHNSVFISGIADRSACRVARARSS
jgi:hypothetical protein